MKKTGDMKRSPSESMEEEVEYDYVDRLEQRMAKVSGSMPQMLNYAPFRFAIALNWKRSFALEPAPASFGAAYHELVRARDEGFLFHGGWSGSYYMVEALLRTGLEAGGMAAVDDEMKREVAAMAVKGSVTYAMQPLSQACAWAIVADEKLSPAEAWRQLRASGAPLWAGGDARALAVVSGFLLRKHVTMPAATWVFGEPPVLLKKLPRRLTRPSMMRRVHQAAVSLYSNVAATFSVQLLLYPIECIRLRLETQFAVYGATRYTNMVDCIRKVWNVEGARGFYRGFRSFAIVAPVELLWPAFAWSVATVIVHAVFEEDPDDDEEEEEENANNFAEK